MQLLPSRSYAERLAALAFACFGAGAWLYGFSCRKPETAVGRLLAALPVLVLLNSAPLLLFHRLTVWPPLLAAAAAGGSPPEPEVLTVAMVEFALTFMCTFKVLLWVCNRGPLAQRWSPLQFAAVMLAPIIPMEATGASSGRPPRPGRVQSERAPSSAIGLLLAFAGKAAMVLAGLWLLRLLDPPLLPREFLYTLGLYVVLSSIMDGPAALASALIGIRVAPHFDAPWRSTSLSDFWSGRWNLAAGSMLRQLVYEPIMEGRLVRHASLQRQRVTRAAEAAAATRRARWRLPATAACFLFSGLMHELQFVYITGHTSRGLMLAFFLLQVPLLVGERWLAMALRRHGLHPPAPLRTGATLGTLLLLSHWTFWAACHKYGITQTSFDAIAGLAGNAQQQLLGLWQAAAKL